MGVLKHPITGKVAIRIRVWMEFKGESPNKPYAVVRRMEERWVAVPGHLVEERPDPWAIEGEEGFTEDPIP